VFHIFFFIEAGDKNTYLFHDCCSSKNSTGVLEAPYTLKTQYLFNMKFRGTVMTRQKRGEIYFENVKISTKRKRRRFCRKRPVTA
jgi:hypothetical protein